MALEPANSPGSAGCRFITGMDEEESGVRKEGVRMCIQPAQTMRSGTGIDVGGVGGVGDVLAVEVGSASGVRRSDGVVLELDGGGVGVGVGVVEEVELDGFKISFARSASYASLAASIESGCAFLYGTRLW